LLADGAIEIEPDADPYNRFLTQDHSMPINRHDEINYFFRLWSIPAPQLYTGKFSDEKATVRDLQLHLSSTGFNAETRT